MSLLASSQVGTGPEGPASVTAEPGESTLGGSTPVGSTPGRSTRQRSTPQRLRTGVAVVGALIVALLAVTVATFTIARHASATMTARAATASSASDLYFALSDLDAEAAREVLLGRGTSASGTDYSSSALTALTEYNARDQQADADLQQLAASPNAAAAGELAHEVTVYRQFAAQGVALDQDTDSPSGQSAPDARGYYGIAATLMQSTVLPEASALRESTAAQLADAAHSAHLDALVGAIGTGLLGLAAALGLLVLHRRISRWFRRSVNLGVLAALLLVAGLSVAATSALTALSGDSSTAGTSFAGYLAVTRTRAAAYDADGAVTRYLLAPNAIAGDPLAGGASASSGNPVSQALAGANGAISTLASSGGSAGGGSTVSGADIADRWHTVSSTDLPSITGSAAGGRMGSALAVDTGTARGQDAFDFYYFDIALLNLSDARITSFTSANTDASAELADWDWLPWALAGAALVAAAAGVRPRLAEFR